MKLIADTILLSVVDTHTIQAAQVAQYTSQLSPDEYRRNQRFRFPEDRQRDLCARALQRSVLANQLGCEPAALVFARGEHGKPELAGEFAQSGLHFNLSHAGQWVALAVAAVPVGVDVEHTERDNDVMAIADRHFYGVELDELLAFAEAEQRERFFDYWTLKEAYMKARGEGIALGLQNFAFTTQRNDRIELHLSEHIDDDPAQWQFHNSTPEPGYRLALAYRSASPLRVCCEAGLGGRPLPAGWQFET